jgi:glycopeptide antibiotics resistance protein
LGEAFSPTVYAFLFLIVLGIIVLFLSEGFEWKSLALLVALLGVTASILPSIKYPEERVHFLEYAILGVILYFALRKNIQGRRILLLIPALVLLIGFGDELIQGILPNRYYQFTDVLLNFSGGILGELILIAFNPSLVKGENSV